LNREQLCETLRSRWYLTTEAIDAILSDRDFFQPYLREALARRARLADVPESPIDVTDCHAIFLLTEMGDPAVIPDLLGCLKMSEKDLRLLYGDSLTEHLWLPFAKLGYSYLEKLWEFVTDESVDLFARHAAVAGVVAMQYFQPESRAATIGFVDRLLGRADIFPIDHLAGILCDCADSGLTELEPVAVRLAEKMAIDEEDYPMATADDVRTAFRDGYRKDFISGRPHNVYGINKQWQRWAEPQEARGSEPPIPDWLKKHTELIENVGTAAASRLEERSSEDSIAVLREHYELSVRLSNLVTTEVEMEELEEVADEDIVGWLLDLPFELARFGMVQEAAKLAQTWAKVTERANFLGDRAVILAEAGWRDEVHQQIEEVLHEFPDDVWVRIKIGDAHRGLGEMEMAERSYRDALKQTVEDYDRDGVLERLVPLLENLGREDEVRALKADEGSRRAEKSAGPADETPAGARPASSKIGRNDLCPCGSGKKYKKCHGR
jgi:hypothetical protein